VSVDVISIPAARVYTAAGWLGSSLVHCEHGVITSIEPLGEASGDVPDRILVPGFIDLQVNGIDDIDVAAANGADWDVLDRALLAQGVTSWCPTLITSPLGQYARPLARAAAAAARHTEDRPRPDLVGVHLEGPFLGGAPGAHRREFLSPIDLDWLADLPPIVAMVTLAPELHGAADAIRLLSDRQILVSLGHTTATEPQFVECVHAGARLITHLFNGMSGLDHRRPGVAAFALTETDISASLIADAVHVHPRMIHLAFTVLGHRAVLVTDAVAWRAATAANAGIELRDGAPRLPDGTLAGSAITMDAAIRVCVEQAGVELHPVVHAASTRPAALLGLDDRGDIVVGLRADLVAFDTDLNVEQVWVGGVTAG
jgi:N-acetylglucosamine-6-phosphate deacetylase